MSSQPAHVTQQQLEDFVVKVLAAVGVPQTDGRIVAECLVMANLSGIDSHGVVRLAHYIRRLENGTIKAQPEMKFTQTASTMGFLDGGDGLGHVVTYHACTHAMEMAAVHGNGVVSIGNSSHFGMAAYYALRMLSQGYIAMVMTATDRMLVPFGARKSFFGTNPICFGFPSDGIPVILDMASTSIAWGKIALAKVEGQSIPASWALDADGNPTTDPAAVAGLHPIAGPKGSGLAMVIDIFCSLLAGMPWGPHINRMYAEMDQRRQLGHFVWALDVRTLMPLEIFKAQLAQMVKELTSLPTAEGFERVYYAGEIEGLRREQRKAAGIPVEPGLYSELAAIGAAYGVDFPG